MNSDKLFDELFDTLLDNAAKQYDSVPESDLPEEEPVDFSEKHEKNMKKIFASYRKKNFLIKAGRYATRIAACIVILATLSCITLVSVNSEILGSVKNFIFRSHGTNTDIRFGEDDNSEYSINGFVMGYIPEGFSIEEQTTTNHIIAMTFRNNSEYFSISILNRDGNTSIDTENAKQEKIQINNTDAFYSENKNGNILAGYNGQHMYVINGNITKDEIIKIAQNLQFNED